MGRGKDYPPLLVMDVIIILRMVDFAGASWNQTNHSVLRTFTIVRKQQMQRSWSSLKVRQKLPLHLVILRRPSFLSN